MAYIPRWPSIDFANSDAGNGRTKVKATTQLPNDDILREEAIHANSEKAWKKANQKIKDAARRAGYR